MRENSNYRGPLEWSKSHLRFVADYVGYVGSPPGKSDRAVPVLLYFAGDHHLVQDRGGLLVPIGYLLSLAQLLLESSNSLGLLISLNVAHLLL